MVARIESGSVTDRGSLVAALKEAGLEVPRQGKNYITVPGPKITGALAAERKHLWPGLEA